MFRYKHSFKFKYIQQNATMTNKCTKQPFCPPDANHTQKNKTKKHAKSTQCRINLRSLRTFLALICDDRFPELSAVQNILLVSVMVSVIAHHVFAFISF